MRLSKYEKETIILTSEGDDKYEYAGEDLRGTGLPNHRCDRTRAWRSSGRWRKA